MNKITKIVLAWVCVILTMTMIFMFSMQNGEKSSQTSTEVVKNVLEITMPKEEITPQVVKKYEFSFRKAAHFSVYLLLGFSLITAFNVTFDKKLKYFEYLISIIIAFGYANLDEFVYQNVSDSRGPSFIDVLIDTAGSLIGIVFFVLILLLMKKISNMKKSHN